MGFYSRYILPRFIDLAMSNREVARLRANLVPQAYGDVLEIGIGSGLNLALYSSQVRRVYGVDPSLELQQLARKRAFSATAPVEFFLQSAEEALPLADASIDTAVLTWTLCSIPNPVNALREIRRVLKGSGRLIFLEHGRAADASVAIWQDRLTPFWRCIAGGCHLNRKADAIITSGGFHVIELKTEYIPGPRLMTYIYQGIAR
jgi:ubiquinone/menaquinone biosynthesis C-methylase UbiE